MTDEPSYGPYDTSSPPPLDFEAWAALSAALLGRPADERDALLAERSVSSALWTACNTFWATQLVTELSNGDDPMVARYAELCRNELQRRASASSSLDATALVAAVAIADPLPFHPAAGARPQLSQSAAAEPPHAAVGQTVEAPLPQLDDPLPFE